MPRYQNHITQLTPAAAALLPQIPEKMQMVFTCGGKTYEEIRDKLFIPLGTVKSRVYRGRAYLRALMTPGQLTNRELKQEKRQLVIDGVYATSKVDRYNAICAEMKLRGLIKEEQ